jgi:hypothetical protein
METIMTAQIIKFPKAKKAPKAAPAPTLPTMTYNEAMFAARQAASERAAKAGRTKWNRSDWNYSVKVFDDLYGRAFRQAIGVE